MNLKDCLLIVFAKNLIEGEVKTRLAAKIGTQKAQLIYQKMCSQLHSEISHLPFDKLVLYSHEVQHQDLWDDQKYQKGRQFGDDLGERMHHAFQTAFSQGYKRVVLVGTDIPELNGSDILKAFSALKSNEFVIGPAEDGGYYLIGCTGECQEIFSDIPWSTSSVFSQTINKMKEQKMRFHCLRSLSDLDTFEDLKYFPSLLKIAYELPA